MAARDMLSTRNRTQSAQQVILRVASPEFDQLKVLVFSRYPKLEWATFARFGWRDCGDTLVITLAGIDAPRAGDLNENVGHVAIDEQYSLRMALGAEKHRLAVGIIHSHPKECAPYPSHIDDDMDGYYSNYFGDFAPGRPYVSLILSVVNGRQVISGRVYWGKEWLIVNHTVAEQEQLDTWPGGNRKRARSYEQDRTERLGGAFGAEAVQRLRESTAVVVGAGGTGSAAIEIFARAGVGRIVVVDPDTIEPSNLERVHGSFRRHADKNISKVVVARDHIREIDSSIEVIALIGRVPQREVVDAIVTADVVLGCTDRQHSRLALSDIAFRYLVPTIDCGVVLEGENGVVTGQVAQFVRFLASDACALCREMIVPTRLSQEMMSDEERALRVDAAEAARARGDDPNPYWERSPQLNTVGYLTTAVGSMAAGYAIGWLTKRFSPPFQRLQMNFVAPFLDVTDLPQRQRPGCACARFRGWADQANADALISAASHWPPVRVMDR